jgi:hypothetical protein
VSAMNKPANDRAGRTIDDCLDAPWTNPWDACHNAADALFHKICERIGQDAALAIFGKFKPLEEQPKDKLRWAQERYVLDQYDLFRCGRSVEKLAADLAAENPTRPPELQICEGSTNVRTITRHIYKLVRERKDQIELGEQRRQAFVELQRKHAEDTRLLEEAGFGPP